ncbi:hypothetical protein HGRIS_004979 [Hohenbuehelia grisea]|uniref:F-box domain-containing protein n=1 Tax=Hohenbuehelia grisea TaxID=104357 RepID=A0ABR3JDK7_9AGAR
MNRCPTEIWALIFSYACTDSGRTGRSLSRVSRYFREVSRHVRLQSIAVHGIDQINAFAALLDSTPPRERRVRYLAISTRPRCRPTSTRSRGSTPYLTNIHQYTISGSPGHYWDTHSARQKLLVALPRIFAMLAPSLYAIHLIVPFRDPARLLPPRMPSLMELHLLTSDLRGQYLDLQPSFSDDKPATKHSRSRAACYPALRRLRFGFLQNTTGVFGRIAKLAPSLTRLEFAIPEHSSLYEDLEVALEPMVPLEAIQLSEDGVHRRDRRSRRTESLPQTLESVVVRMSRPPDATKSPGWAQMHAVTFDALTRLAVKDSRVVLVQS